MYAILSFEIDTQSTYLQPDLSQVSAQDTNRCVAIESSHLVSFKL